jgi:hypothetical protein
MYDYEDYNKYDYFKSYAEIEEEILDDCHRNVNITAILCKLDEYLEQEYIDDSDYSELYKTLCLEEQMV